MICINMALPESCAECEFITNGRLSQYCGFPRNGVDVTIYEQSRHPSCPLIEDEEGE